MMTEIQKLILELEEDAKQLNKKADSIDPTGFGYVQQKAILGLQKSLRGIWGWEIGELKNAFGIGECQKQNAQKR